MWYLWPSFLISFSAHRFTCSQMCQTLPLLNLAGRKNLLICTHVASVLLRVTLVESERRAVSVPHSRDHVLLFAYAKAHHRRHKIRVHGFCVQKEIHCGRLAAWWRLVVAVVAHTPLPTRDLNDTTRRSPIHCVYSNSQNKKGKSAHRFHPVVSTRHKKRYMWASMRRRAECRCKRDTLKIIHSDNFSAVAV